MRNFLVLAPILGSAPICVFNPYYGIVVWTWIAYFNPHRYAYGFVYTFPVAMVIAIPTLVGTLLTRYKNLRVLVGETKTLLALWVWFALTTAYVQYVPSFAGHAKDAVYAFEQISKILLMTVVTVLLITSRKRLRILILVTLLSFGVRTLFGAVFAIRTGGAFRMYGPEDSFISENNDFALALNMVLPMFFFLARSETNRWLRLSLRVMMFATVICILGTYSRGGLLGLSVVTIGLVAQSKQKVMTVGLAISGILLVLTFSPPQWKDRMAHFIHGDVDESAADRLATWQAGWKLAMDYPVTGGGFGAYPDPALFIHYLPGATPETDFKGPHSIYFQILGEQGFIGLALFILLLGMCYRTTYKLGRQAKIYPQLAWITNYSSMFKLSLLAYIVNGATLGRSYFDLMYQVVAYVIALKIIYLRELSHVPSPPRPFFGINTEAVTYYSTEPQFS